MILTRTHIEQILRDAHAEGFRHGLEHSCGVMAGLITETAEQSIERAFKSSAARMTALRGFVEVHRKVDS